jgi:hypothetical protein
MTETFDAYVLEERGPAVLRQLSEPDLQILAGQVRGRVVIEIGR